MKSDYTLGLRRVTLSRREAGTVLVSLRHGEQEIAGASWSVNPGTDSITAIQAGDETLAVADAVQILQRLLTVETADHLPGSSH